MLLNWCSCGCVIGPKSWSSINKDCAGRYQSPINIDTESTKLNELLTEISLIVHNVTGDRITVINNGHTGQSDQSLGSPLGRSFDPFDQSLGSTTRSSFDWPVQYLCKRFSIRCTMHTN